MNQPKMNTPRSNVVSTLRSPRLAAFTLALGVACAATGAYANLLTNGSFEDAEDFAGWDFSGTVQIQTDPGDLTTTNSNYRVGQTDGSRAAAFNYTGTGVNDGIISQSFSTEIGQTYTVSFDYGLYGVSGSGVSADLNVAVTGITTLYSALYTDDTGSEGGYVLTTNAGSYSSYSFTFVADSISSTISFSDAATSQMGGNDTALDNISITAIPEPSTFALLGGLAALGLVAAKRRRNHA